MQQFATQNSGLRYLFVAVDILSRFLWVIGVESKNSKACTDALKKIIATSRQRNAPKIWSSKIYPDKIWADQGKDFAGNFSQFFKNNGIEIYNTKREKSALAERYIRTLKSIICRCLHELDTHRYIDKLRKYVSIINYRISRMTEVGSNNRTWVGSKRCSLLSMFLQYCAATSTKVQSWRPSSHSEENWNFPSWLQDTIHWRTFHNFTHTYKKSPHICCQRRERRNHAR